MKTSQERKTNWRKNLLTTYTATCWAWCKNNEHTFLNNGEIVVNQQTIKIVCFWEIAGRVFK